MHHKSTKHGKDYLQNNQIMIKSHVECEDNPNEGPDSWGFVHWEVKQVQKA